MTSQRTQRVSFQEQAEQILSLEVVDRVNRLGGYGSRGEVIYEAHPTACPSTLVSNQGSATCTFLSNGSLDFEVKLENGMTVHVLDGHFDAVEKRESGVPSANAWLEFVQEREKYAASLINPRFNRNLPAHRIKVVKIGDPDRAMWYCAFFEAAGGIRFETAVRLRLVRTARGPALVREVLVKNTGSQGVCGNVWTYLNLHGSQRFVYHKQLWYDAGTPVTRHDTVTAATVPHEDVLQIKRVSSQVMNGVAEENTCDYSTFIGDTAASALMPEAILQGHLLAVGARERLNRFATASISASRFSFDLAPGGSAVVTQALLYVDDPQAIQRFRRLSSCPRASYEYLEQAFRRAALDLLRHTPDAQTIAGRSQAARKARGHPAFEIRLPAEPTVAAYINSVWTSVQELYEKCRAHGARLADGIEVGTRDRSQDMWPKMKEDPAQVRADLVHALSLMYVTLDEPPPPGQRLTLAQKLHGMFPRQFPSRWLDRGMAVHNDNRPYADSPLWLVDALLMYAREMGDLSILQEQVGTVRLTDPDHPETAAITGAERTLRIVEVLFEVFSAYQRHVADSPYHLAQILFGDWCDPVDMFGTAIVGDPTTRAQGRGAQVRLSAHLFLCLVNAIDVLSAPRVQAALAEFSLQKRLEEWKAFASRLRQSIVQVAWEDDGRAGAHPHDCPAGFVDSIHEFRADGSLPDYAAGETGYTLGSMRGRDFDGVSRRVLTTQAYCLAMLKTDRDYLEKVDGADEMVRKLLQTVDTQFYNPQLGLLLYTTPIANGPQSVRLVGRMGIVPPGCAENGEYHHAQMFMHHIRLSLPGEASRVWEQFRPALSVSRDESIGGPFDITSNSYVSDTADPHFGQGMYFGLSGSVDWMVEIVHKIAGLELALHDDSRPAVRVCPNLPVQLKDALTFKRTIHQALPSGGYRRIPLTIQTTRKGSGSRLVDTQVRINGKRQAVAEVQDLDGFDRLNIEIVYVYQT